MACQIMDGGREMLRLTCVAVTANRGIVFMGSVYVPHPADRLGEQASREGIR